MLAIMAVILAVIASVICLCISYARGDYNNESDADILITVALYRSDLSKYRKALATISSDLSLKHDVTISLIVKPYNEFILYSNSLPFNKNVIEEEIRYATCC